MSTQHQSGCLCSSCSGSTELTPVVISNRPGLSALSYRVGTHGRFKQSMLLSLSQQEALRKFSSRDNDDMAIATIDAWANVLDILGFYQERIIQEGFLRTATERRSILELSRHISYTLAPGVAASTYLAFTMSESAGAPERAVVVSGTQVQSIPEQNQLPQLFETTEELEARKEWNAITVQTTRTQKIAYGDRSVYLNGITTGLQAGDAILFVGDERIDDKTNENWDFRRLTSVTADTTNNRTLVTWDKGLGDFAYNKKTLPASKNVTVYAFRQKASLFGYNAPDWRNMSKETRNRYLGVAANASDSDTNVETEWKKLTISDISGQATDTIYLDALYAKVVPDTWLVIATNEYEELYSVLDATESSRKNFTISAKTTRAKLSGENLVEKFNDHVRDAVIFIQPEELDFAEMPVDDYLNNGKEVTLSMLMADLPEEKKIILSGKRQRMILNEANKYPQFVVTDNAAASRVLKANDSLIITAFPTVQADGKEAWPLLDENGNTGTITIAPGKYTIGNALPGDPVVSELHTIASLKAAADPTVIVLEELVENRFDPTTLVIYGNVAPATHGETRNETLGSGNASTTFQRFQLKQTPLTFVSASVPGGIQSTLVVKVNDITWQEVSDLYSAGPKDKVYTCSIGDDGSVTILFGDGITGSRLPTGNENIKATYRVGIGSDALLNEGQLSMLLTPQLGLNKVSNPLPTEGAEDPEVMDDARINAPLTVLTLDRIVSVRDFEDFTRAYAGIGKARADLLWNGEQEVVYITIASSDGGQLDKEGDQYKNLVKAITNAGHTRRPVMVENFTALSFSVNARIRIDDAYDFDIVSTAATDALTNAFSFANRRFGQDVNPSEVIAVLQAVDGVVYIDLESLNGFNPFGSEHFRLNAEIARCTGNTNLPAELLVINEKQITLTQILS